MKEIKIGIIGLGLRGMGNLSTILNIEGVSPIAVCDVYEDRCEEGAKLIKEKCGYNAFTSTDYKEILKMPEVEAVMVFTSWETHIPIAIAAMDSKKAVALEVGGAKDIKECYDLVAAYERNNVPFMFLENCCYNKTELMVRNMVRDGLFGEVVYCHGAYAHDLREEVSTGKEKRHYRLNHYLNTNCDNYPTHDLGPIAKILDINRGNRMVRLVSMASKSAGLKQYINDRKDTFENKDLIGAEFAQGDIVDTLITCENGEAISLRLDTTLPRSYSREFTVRGTEGLYEENTNTVFFDGDAEEWEPALHYKKTSDNAIRYEAKYLPDYWKNLTKEEAEMGHGGMDYFEFCDFFGRLRNNKPMPIDVYDAASWMCISALSKKSIEGGNIPMDIPDFTNGKWKTRERFDV